MAGSLDIKKEKKKISPKNIWLVISVGLAVLSYPVYRAFYCPSWKISCQAFWGKEKPGLIVFLLIVLIGILLRPIIMKRINK